MTDLRDQLRRVAETLPGLVFETWNFGDSVGFEALLAVSEALGDERWRAFAHGWARCWASRSRPFRRLDCTAPGQAMVRLAAHYSDGVLVRALSDLARYLMARPTLHGVFETWDSAPLLHPYGGERLPVDEEALLHNPPPGVFVDCLHFDPPLFTSLGWLTGDGALVRAGATQARGYADLLQQPSGLYDHFALRGVPNRTFGSAWGRGQGWALLGLLDVLSQLPESDAARRHLAGSARRLIEAMLESQCPDGHWYAVVTDPASGIETSTAAFMAAGFRRAARLGVVPAEEVSDAADAAFRAALKATDERGVLGGVSVAVLAATRQSHYARVPRGVLVPWGQGPLALALAEAV